MRSLLLASVLLAMSVGAAYSSCGEDETEQCVGPICHCFPRVNLPSVPNPIPPPNNPLPSLDPSILNPSDLARAAFPGAAAALDAAKNSGDPNLVAAAQNVEAVGAKLDKETQTAISDALTNPVQGVKDAVQTHIKAANDVIDAVRASARYAERAVSGYGDVLSKAESRVREGKVVDAMWHLGTDQLQSNNENAAKLMQESEAARQAAQAAASLYGGPAGTAAFAAWMAYNSSGHNVEAALRAGAYAYVVSKGYAEVNTMPTGTVDEVAKKAAVTAGVRGMAVAAAGGSQQDILNAAAQGGGSVIVQSGQAYVTKEYVDPAKARADAFCMDAVNASCADAKQWLQDSKDRLEQYKAIADSLANTVTTDDGRWTISWDNKVLLDPNSKAPGVVLTYIGDGSPYEQQMLQLASLGDPGKFTPPAIESTSWTAFRAPGGTSPYFDHVAPEGHLAATIVGAESTVAPDDLLGANTSVNVRPGPAGGGWGEPIDVLTPGETIKVLEVKTASTKIGPQEWIRFGRIP
ncbi:hypothetical protein [Bradyrhizobium sp. Ec3.3]|uniref:hypothetical protein n=1 Tax=Bradyrhizobium sp. Ec3.3 TaxID=189753 RepID=UPI000426636B|nr:hypothetical protein [Bradyrhizobium sp. Ec3.3]